jgi:hypothetical protein
VGVILMEIKTAEHILRKNKINAMRDFSMMMKENNFQVFLGNLVAYRSKEGSEKFNEAIIKMNEIIYPKENVAN